MAEEESVKKLHEWIIMQRRGRNKILRASKDPIARARLFTEIPSPNPVVLHISESDRVSALTSLPAFLFSGPAVESGQTPISIQGYRSFLTTFPPEVRNIIYHYAIGYPTCRNLYDYYYDQKEKAKAKIELRPRSANTRVSRHSKIILRTPAILLLCKQITREVLSFLYLQPFVIDRIPPWIMGNSAPLSIVNFISRATLQKLRFVQIKISLGDSIEFGSGKVWLRLLNDVLDAWSERNSLVRLEVMFKLSHITRPNIWTYELEYYETLVNKLSYFEFKHGSKPSLIRWEHWVIDFGYAYRVGHRNPLIRVHPDPYIWQGSVIEWL
ncbi:uncharacterized protein F4812DRAFT_272627 [Daldinia caldariorum]|uniref:uncharacterized protein n=1 Tax=Daldinia caldariorum TaxID=326644 RepID=UPI002007C95A|nr:uncharacterized protein F4812DRAFT_272627 [Daldinia caldariorum]KAI1470623.1 hypothetical protein F4812DRAFT_272627 [Daldinia caldariorum]